MKRHLVVVENGSTKATTVSREERPQDPRRLLVYNKMHCPEHDLLWKQHRAALANFRASIGDLAALVDSSSKDRDFTLAHWRIRAAGGACAVARAALELRQRRTFRESPGSDSSCKALQATPPPKNS